MSSVEALQRLSTFTAFSLLNSTHHNMLGIFQICSCWSSVGDKLKMLKSPADAGTSVEAHEYEQVFCMQNKTFS